MNSLKQRIPELNLTEDQKKEVGASHQPNYSPPHSQKKEEEQTIHKPPAKKNS